MDGQMNFDSGWEWSYWLNDVITARANWDPLLHISDPWEAFEYSLQPYVRLYPKHIGQPLGGLLVKLTRMQEQLLVYGNISYNVSIDQCLADNSTCQVEGVDIMRVQSCSGQVTTSYIASSTGEVKYSHTEKTNKLSGLAFLQGDDTWIDLPRLIGLHLLQPDKVHIQEHNDAMWQHALYLLSEIEKGLIPLHEELQGLVRDAMVDLESSGTVLSKMSVGLLIEIFDSVTLLLLRVQQVHMLYRSRDIDTTHEQASSLQTRSRELINHAALVVLERERNYRVPWQRIGG